MIPRARRAGSCGAEIRGGCRGHNWPGELHRRVDALGCHSVSTRSLSRGSKASYGRGLVATWTVAALRDTPTPSVLDIGCGAGMDLLGVRRVLHPKPVELHGIDISEKQVNRAASNGVQAEQVDIEASPLPYPAEAFDLVIANQVLEHIKQIFWVLDEIHRVLKPAGSLIVGVPNLASLHNRLLLLVGKQPSSIRLVGPHVRGFTPGSLRQLLAAGFSVEQTAGVNFYPWPALAKVWPAAAVTSFVLARKTGGSFGRLVGPEMSGTSFRSGALPDHNVEERSVHVES